MNTAPRLTLVLVGLNSLVFIVMVFGGVSLWEPQAVDLVKWGALYGPLTRGGEWWRVVTSTVLHGGIIHLVLNMVCLLQLGPVSERLFGTWPVLAVYVLSAIGGALASLVVHPDVVGVGASAGIFGLGSALIVAIAVRPLPDEMAGIRALVPRLAGFLGVNLLFGFAQPGIDNAAHIGGLLMGAVLGWAVLTFRHAAAPFSYRRLAGVSASAAIIMMLVAWQLARARPVSPGELVAIRAEIRAATSDANADASRQRTLEQLTAALEQRTGHLERVVREYPDSADAHHQLGTAYLQAGRVPDAVRELRHARVLAPRHADVLTALGTAELQADDLDSAVSAYAQAWSAAGRTEDAAYNLAFAYLTRGRRLAAAGDRDLARRDFEQVIRLNAVRAFRDEAAKELDALRQ